MSDGRVDLDRPRYTMDEQPARTVKVEGEDRYFAACWDILDTWNDDEYVTTCATREEAEWKIAEFEERERRTGMRRFIVRPREGERMVLDGRSPRLVPVTWWDVIDTTTGQQMTERSTEKLAYEAAKELERTHQTPRKERRAWNS